MELALTAHQGTKKRATDRLCRSNFSGKGGIRTPGTVARTPHFECGPIDHSGTFPIGFAGANVRIYFLIPTVSTKYLRFFLIKYRFLTILINISIIFAILKDETNSFCV